MATHDGAQAGAGSSPEVVEVGRLDTAVVRGRVPTAELAGFFDRSFTELGRVLGEGGVVPLGPAFARYHGPPADEAVLEVGFPVAEPPEPVGDVVPGTLPAGRVARLVHHGGFDGLGGAWERLRAWVAEQGLATGDALWEVYLVEPTPEMDPADLRTELNWALDQ